MRLLVLAISLLCIAAGLLAPTASARPKATLAIADQHGETFADPMFTALGVKHARLNFAWDALDYDWQVVEIDKWMANAQAAGVTPLVIFSQSRVQGRTRLLPSPGEFARVVDAVRARYPFVREFTAWNEANHAGQPSYKHPAAIARFYKILRRKCRGCNVLPASLLDNPNLVPWTRRLRKAIRRLKQPEPRLWGLHNYSDVNRLRDTSTRKLLRAVKGRVWITESAASSPRPARPRRSSPRAPTTRRASLATSRVRFSGATRASPASTSTTGRRSPAPSAGTPGS